jgi:hypothetical protein
MLHRQHVCVQIINKETYNMDLVIILNSKRYISDFYKWRPGRRDLFHCKDGRPIDPQIEQRRWRLLKMEIADFF